MDDGSGSKWLSFVMLNPSSLAFSAVARRQLGAERLERLEDPRGRTLEVVVDNVDYKPWGVSNGAVTGWGGSSDEPR